MNKYKEEVKVRMRHYLLVPLPSHHLPSFPQIKDLQFYKEEVFFSLFTDSIVSSGVNSWPPVSKQRLGDNFVWEIKIKWYLHRWHSLLFFQHVRIAYQPVTMGVFLQIRNMKLVKHCWMSFNYAWPWLFKLLNDSSTPTLNMPTNLFWTQMTSSLLF